MNRHSIRSLSLASVLLLSVPLLLWALAGAGCGSGESAGRQKESNVIGYLSPSGHKFYTDKNVAARKCPRTGSFQIQQVVAYIGENWKPGATNYVIAPLSIAGLTDSSGRVYRRMILPTAEQLEAWGAVKATAEEVGAETP